MKFKYGTSAWTWHGHSICITKPVMVSETYYVDVCDGGEDKYRFGFNGQEKDNEMKGVGNSLDFGARMYDSRLGRFLSLDPLSRGFPSESNYIFAGNSPLFFIDKEGKKKTVYHYVIDLRNNKITLPTKGIIVDGLHGIHYSNYMGGDGWRWYDYSVNQVTVISESGRKFVYESSPFEINYKNIRSEGISPFETFARLEVGESAYDWTMSKKEGDPGKTYDGYRFVSKRNYPWIGRDNHLNKTGSSESPTIYIDELLDVLGIAGNAMGSKQPKNPVEAIKYLNDAVNTTDRVQNFAPFNKKEKANTTFHCETCKENFERDENGNNTYKKSGSNATDTVPNHYHK